MEPNAAALRVYVSRKNITGIIQYVRVLFDRSILGRRPQCRIRRSTIIRRTQSWDILVAHDRPAGYRGCPIRFSRVARNKQRALKCTTNEWKPRYVDELG